MNYNRHLSLAYDDSWVGLIENASGKLTFQEAKEALDNAINAKKYAILGALDNARDRYNNDEIQTMDEYIETIKKIVCNA